MRRLRELNGAAITRVEITAASYGCSCWAGECAEDLLGRRHAPEVDQSQQVGGTVMHGKTEPVPERYSIQTLVATRQEGDEWRLAAFQNTRLHPIDSSAGVFLIWTLSDPLWKVYRLTTQRMRRRQGG